MAVLERRGRIGRVAAWASAIACVPYLVLKVAWALDVPLGIEDESVLDEGGWIAANAVMAVLQLVALVLVLALTRSWSRRVPELLLLFPVWVGTGLLFQVSVGAVLMGLFARPESSGDDFGGIAPWVFLLVYSAFAVQGVALAVTFGSHVRARWGDLLRRRTGEVVSTRHAGAVAWLTAAVAVVAVYWAAGGGVGESRSDPPVGFHVSTAVGAVFATAGLLAFAGRWGGRRRLWLPATLLWLGSGSIAAFDGLNLLLMRLVDAEPWALGDLVAVARVAIGLAAGAVLLASVRPVRYDRTHVRFALGHGQRAGGAAGT